jgi:hypothetical protein
MPGLELIERISTVAHQRQPLSLAELCKLKYSLHLLERLASREGHASQIAVLHDLIKYLAYSHVLACIKCPRLRIVAAVAVMRTALYKKHIAKSRPVHDGLRLDTAYSYYLVSGVLIHAHP